MRYKLREEKKTKTHLNAIIYGSAAPTHLSLGVAVHRTRITFWDWNVNYLSLNRNDSFPRWNIVIKCSRFREESHYSCQSNFHRGLKYILDETLSQRQFSICVPAECEGKRRRNHINLQSIIVIWRTARIRCCSTFNAITAIGSSRHCRSVR